MMLILEGIVFDLSPEFVDMSRRKTELDRDKGEISAEMKADLYDGLALEFAEWGYFIVSKNCEKHALENRKIH